MAIHLDFLNKNMYRKYPLVGTSTGLFDSGDVLPQELITSIQISIPYGLHDLYISKVYAARSFISLTLRQISTNDAIGHFSGFVIDNQTVLNLTPYIDTVSGTITIGLASAVTSLNGSYTLSVENGTLEPSTIFCFTPPAVTSLSKDDVKARGNITLVLENLALDISSALALSVINDRTIRSSNDLISTLGNCKTPRIRKINTVSPSPSGNIDVYGILPISIDVSSGTVNPITALTLDDVCPERTKIYPPENNSDTYYTDVLTATEPEWKTWPQFS